MSEGMKHSSRGNSLMFSSCKLCLLKRQGSILSRRSWLPEELKIQARDGSIWRENDGLSEGCGSRSQEGWQPATNLISSWAKGKGHPWGVSPSKTHRVIINIYRKLQLLARKDTRQLTNITAINSGDNSRKWLLLVWLTEETTDVQWDAEMRQRCAASICRMKIPGRSGCPAPEPTPEADRDCSYDITLPGPFLFSGCSHLLPR